MFDNNQKIFNILIVGAGGIGCELIKNLYKTRNKITIVDFDTIQLTNLNRQFCFKQSDIGRYKVQCLYQFFNKLNPNFIPSILTCNILQLPTIFFSDFDILISALDNIQSRNYLNKMSIKNSIPMIDAGTSGYNGQSQFFIRGVTQCRMCRYTASQNQAQNMALCSIRGKPDRNVHCVYFAMNVFGELVEGKGMECGRIVQKWKNGGKKNQEMQRVCVEVFNCLFDVDLESVKRIKIQNVEEIVKLKESFVQVNQQILLSTNLNIQFYKLMFILALETLLTKNKILKFDKDCFEHIQFVWICTNLRILNFIHLPNSKLKPINFYQVKDISGKIIPAISSTNSIVAALQVLTIQNLSKQNLKYNYSSVKGFSNQFKIQSFLQLKPKQNCLHCSIFCQYKRLYFNFSKVTWGQLQQFLCQNISSTFSKRDLRSQNMIIIKNTGSRPFRENKFKKVYLNKQIIKFYKQKAFISIQYFPSLSLQNSVNFNKSIDVMDYVYWQFVAIDTKNSQSILLEPIYNKQQLYSGILSNLQKISKTLLIQNQQLLTPEIVN